MWRGVVEAVWGGWFLGEYFVAKTMMTKNGWSFGGGDDVV